MSLGSHLPANRIVLTGYSPSVGGTPVATYMLAPCRGRLFDVTATLRGALTTADATVTVTNVTTSTTIATFTLTQAGSAAGSSFTSSEGGMEAARTVNRDDVISITPSGASGASIAADFRVRFLVGGV